jgi:Holliday junction resolvase-like predicted endonuclease
MGLGGEKIAANDLPSQHYGVLDRRMTARTNAIDIISVRQKGRII